MSLFPFLLVLLIPLVSSNIFLDRFGEQSIDSILGQALKLPNTTQFANASGSYSLAVELNRLRTDLTTLSTTVTQLSLSLAAIQNNVGNLRHGCNWTGVYCNCYYENTATQAAVLLGSYCNNGTLEWIETLDMTIATFVSSCLGTVNTSRCDGYF